MSRAHIVTGPKWTRLVLPAAACVAAAYVLWRLTTNAMPAPPRMVIGALPVYLALWLATIVLQAARWRMVLRRLGTDRGLALLTRLWLAARAVGTVIPSGTLAGEPLRAQLLIATGVPAASAGGAVALDRALELAGNVIVGPLSVGAALALGAGSGAAGLVAAAGALVGLALLIVVYVRAGRGRPALTPLLAPPIALLPAAWRPRLASTIAGADEGLRRILADHPRLVPAGLGVSLLIEALHLFELAALFRVFALGVPLPLLFLSSLGIGVAHAVPVAAALGTLEATQVGLFTVGGEPLATGLGVAMALRLAETAWILAGLACLATAPSRAQARGIAPC